MKYKCTLLWSNITLFTVLSFILTMLTACNDDKEKDEPDAPTAGKIEYYVKYEIKTTSRYIYNTFDVTYTSEKGLETKTVPVNWEGTFGPFTKIDKLVLSIHCEPSHVYNTSTYNGRISICRGNQPYILKADYTISNKPLSMQYQVTDEDVR